MSHLCDGEAAQHKEADGAPAMTARWRWFEVRYAVDFDLPYTTKHPTTCSRSGILKVCCGVEPHLGGAQEEKCNFFNKNMKFKNVSVERKTQQCIVRTAEKTIGVSLSSIQDIFQRHCAH